MAHISYIKPHGTAMLGGKYGKIDFDQMISGFTRYWLIGLQHPHNKFLALFATLDLHAPNGSSHELKEKLFCWDQWVMERSEVASMSNEGI